MLPLAAQEPPRQHNYSRLVGFLGRLAEIPGLELAGILKASLKERFEPGLADKAILLADEFHAVNLSIFTGCCTRSNRVRWTSAEK